MVVGQLLVVRERGVLGFLVLHEGNGLWFSISHGWGDSEELTAKRESIKALWRAVSHTECDVGWPGEGAGSGMAAEEW